jgi:hypothetical protein
MERPARDGSMLVLPLRFERRNACVQDRCLGGLATGAWLRELGYGSLIWCARRDLNPQGFTRRSLSAMRLPVPPRAQCFEDSWCRQGESNTRHPACEGGGLPLPMPALSLPSPKPERSRTSDLRVEGAPYAQGRHPGRSHRSILADRNSCRPRAGGQPGAHRAPPAGRQRRAQ